MESFITTNDLLKQTALPDIFHKGQVQQKADAFLSAMQEKYAEDAQFKYIMDAVKQEKYQPLSIENPFKSAKVAGYLARMYNWIRDHELQQLRQDYDNAQELVFSLFWSFLTSAPDCKRYREKKRYQQGY
jgi:hypothetical protein